MYGKFVYLGEKKNRIKIFGNRERQICGHTRDLVAEVLTKREILNKPGTVGCSSSISDITDYVVTAESKEMS